MRKALALLIRLTSLLNAVATIWTLFLVFFVTADVCGRVFFGRPLTGAPEVVKMSLVALVFLHMPHALWKGRHIRSELLISRLTPNLRTVMEVIMWLLGVFMFTAIVISSWHHMVDAWQTGIYEGEGSLRVPLAPVRTIVILGSMLTALLYLVGAVQRMAKLRRLSKGDP